MRNFLWKDFGNQNGSHLVRWDFVTRPKDKGGIGIDKVRITNEALLGKWIWRYVTEPDQLWRSLIDGIYATCTPGSIPSLNNFGSARAPWYQIRKMESIIISQTKWKIKSGSNILFWHHNWDGGIAKRITCPRFYNISENKVITIKDAWNSNQSSWNPSFRRPLLDREMQVWKSLSSGWQTPIQTEETGHNPLEPGR